VWSPEVLAHSDIVHDLALLASDVNSVLDGTTAATMTRLYTFYADRFPIEPTLFFNTLANDLFE
jgi:hypothetical protein